MCKNCTFYEPGAHWDCRETIPEAVRDKERANFCDYFKLRPGTTADSRSGENPGATNSGAAADKARDAFNGLFGG